MIDVAGDSLTGQINQALGEDSRPRIRIQPGRLHEYAADTELLIVDETYVRGGTLVRIGLSPELSAYADTAIQRDERQAVVVPLTREYLQRRLTEVARFEVYKERKKSSGWVMIDCPMGLAGNIIGLGDWPNFNTLTAIATAPFIRPDLSICTAPGYDQVTGVYLRPTRAVPDIPEHPTREQAESALASLLAPFSQFPFADPAHKAVFAAHALTAVVRVTLGTSPVFFYTAPVPATGKTLLSRMPSVIATGVDPAVRPYTDESEEMRKVLYASLLAGDASLLFDNVPNGMKIRSPILCGFATAATYSDRRLGASESCKLPNRVVMSISGNNITPTGDMARRSLVCRLDTNAETARGRQFEIPCLAEHVTRQHPHLLAAALTIVRAYIIAGCPKVAHPLESFESWSQLCRDPLIWLGMADAVDSQEGETDEEVDVYRATFQALAAAYGPREFTARTLANDMGSAAMEIRAALDAAGCSDSSDATKIGYWLRAARDRVAGPYKLVGRSAHGGTPQWRLRNIVEKA